MTPEERGVRVLARIKELDDPERPTPYALHALITREVEEAIAETREACAKIVEASPCDAGCDNWLRLTDAIRRGHEDPST